MKKNIIWLTGLSILASSLVWANAPEISNNRIEVVLKQVETSMPQQPDAPKMDKAKLRQDIVQDLKISEVLKNEAFKVGLDKQPDVQANWQNNQAKFYANEYMMYLRSQVEVNDTELKQQYNLLSTEINLLPISFTSKADADAGLEKLKKGLSFEALLKQVAPQAPSEMWINPQQLPPEIANWAMQLKKGQISAKAIKLGDQYYLLKLAGVRHSPDAPAFDKVKDQLREAAKTEKVKKQIIQLLQQNGIQQP